MPNDAELFLKHVEAVCGKKADSFSRIDASEPDQPPVHVLFFHDVPESGYTTAVTFGLSLANHPEWKVGKPELLLCVQSADETWGEAVASVVEAFRGECPFRYGDVLHYGQPIAPESAMSAFLIFAPALAARWLTQEEATVSLPDRTVFLVGIYPLYEAEVATLQRLGLDALWNREGFAPWNVQRPALIP